MKSYNYLLCPSMTFWLSYVHEHHLDQHTTLQQFLNPDDFLGFPPTTTYLAFVVDIVTTNCPTVLPKKKKQIVLQV